MTHEEAEKLKSAQLEIMDEIHRICVKNNVKYYIVGGTLIGAVRHKGFIPWDVDIDIAMYRKDYLKFKQLCQVELDIKFEYRDYLNTRNFNHPHALVCMKGTKVYSKFDEFNIKSENLGIYIDIFPLDNAPDDSYKREKQASKLIRINRLKNYRIPYYYSPKAYRRIIKSILRGLFLWISVERINKIQQVEMQRYDSESTECVCNMAGRYSYEKECHSKEVFGNGTLLEFDGRKYYAPDRYHEYLTKIYGDYMTIPSAEKQKANLDVFSKVVFNEE